MKGVNVRETADDIEAKRFQKIHIQDNTHNESLLTLHVSLLRKIDTSSKEDYIYKITTFCSGY